MYQEQRAARGTTVTFTLEPDPKLAPTTGFDWLVSPLQISAGLLGLTPCLSSGVRAVAASLVPIGLPIGLGCGTGTGVRLSARFIAPAITGSYQVSFLIKSLDDPDLYLEIDAGRLFVTPGLALVRRGTLGPPTSGNGLFINRVPLLPVRYFASQHHIQDNYGLGRMVAVEIFNSDGIAIMADVEFSADLNTLDIFFSQPVSGTYLLYSDRVPIQAPRYFANQLHLHDDYGLGRQVGVEIFNVNGLQVEADVQFSADLNSLDIFFSQPFTGSYQLY